MLFPIHKHELRKFIPLTVVFCLLSVTYAILRPLKEMFLLQHTTVEAIYCLKLFSTPSMILLTLLYSVVSKATDRDGRFNVVVSYFLIFFTIAYLLLIPHLGTLQLDQLADNLTARMPRFKNLWELLRIWPLSLFYLHVEGWVTMVWGVAFWTFINEITSLEQARRFYSSLGLGAEIGLILAGTFLKYSQLDLNTLLSLGLVMMVGILVAYNILARDIDRNPALYQIAQKPLAPKEPRSLIDSFKFLAKSTYLARLASLVLLFGSSYTLFEAVWNAQIKILIESNSFSDNELTNIYGNQGIFDGFLSIVLTLFVAAPVMRRGWRFAASFTPILMLVATIIFFVFLYFQHSLHTITDYWGVSPLLLAVMFGMFNLSFVRSAGYILFNPTKEQVYIPLDEDSRVHGKAAVDGVGLRLGRSLGSLILVFIVGPLFGSINNAKVCIFIIILSLLILWLRVVKKLGIAYEKRVAEKSVA